MEIIEVIFLTLAIFLVIVSTISVICLFRVNKKIKARPINEDLLFKIMRKMEVCAKRHNKNISINDKCQIITDAYDCFIEEYLDSNIEKFDRYLEGFIESRIEGMGAHL